MKVSVIIPIYNAEKYLKECMDSILKQTLQDIEIICVNDGSSDNSLGILEEYSKKDSRITICSQENKGAGAARNYGLQYAKGEYLSFLDADDVFESDMLETAYVNGMNNNADICVFRCDLFSKSIKVRRGCPWTLKKRYVPENNPFSSSDIKDYIFNFCNGWAWDKLFKRSFVEKNGQFFQEIRTSNDLFFVYSSIAKAESIYIIDKILVHQRINVAGSLTATREKSYDCFYMALSALKKELLRTGLYEKFSRSFINIALEISMWNFNTLREPSFKKLYKIMTGEGFENLDITKKDKSYFYHKSEYKQFEKINNTPYESFRQKNRYTRFLGKFIDTCKNEGFMSAILRVRSKL